MLTEERVPAGSTMARFVGVMIVVGLILGTVGLDGLTAHPRFTFGSLHFVDGISFVAMALGPFGVSEILINLENVASIRPMRPTLRSLVPTAKDLRDSAPAIGRGTIIGFLMGIVPGISHVVSTFVSYAVEKRLSKEPEAFRRSLTISNGDFSIFVDSTTSKVLLGAVIVVVAVQGIAWYLGWRGRSVRPDD